ncbi:FAD-binding protein [Adlercreutzia equolifaciens]|uniref:FAD-binding protein n=1 Tax=Adlercreutzia equolifaciens TaxID=446660 RepID=UPI0023AEF882|nr:FAD-binding protein [Adlercreutzia equolifaciens]MDE8701366.1 FAD-binding protein [Adlercreutzia equolifaciens]
MTMDRRGFFKGAALAATAVAGASLAGCAPQAPSQLSDTGQGGSFEENTAWDAEFDVVVMGYGLAGATASLAAADEGANVLLIEKAPHGQDGGNSRYCGQAVLEVAGGDSNRDGAIEYLKTIRGEYLTPEDDIIEAFIDAILELPSWYEAHGGKPVTLWTGVGEFRDIEGWDLMDCWTENGAPWNAGVYNCLQRAIESTENITVWYSSPAEDLIQDPDTGVVVGVQVDANGQSLKVRARNGVVMTTGGFENDIQMIQNFHQLPYAYGKGATMNTGDGIKMAMRIGADLWHMNNIAGPDLNAINMDINRSYGYGCIGAAANKYLTTEFSLGSVIVVGADGTRFTDESILPGHGFVNYHGMYLRQPVSLPAYCVFDEASFGRTIYRQWDNNEKLEEGIIIKANTLAELTSALNLPEGSLDAEVAEYNQFCANGDDVRYHRPAEYLVPLDEKGPFYAFEVRPAYTNTQGGPRRNKDGNIVDTLGQPIAHLYSAGECGSIWGDIYQGAGNVGECLAYGLISGRNAAAEKDDSSRDTLATNDAVANLAYVPDPLQFETGANEYVGIAYGVGGAMAVKATVDGSTISAIEVLQNNETGDVGGAALPKLVDIALDAQDLAFDAVTGATSTTNAFKQALEAAYADAGLNITIPTAEGGAVDYEEQ